MQVAALLLLSIGVLAVENDAEYLGNLLCAFAVVIAFLGAILEGA